MSTASGTATGPGTGPTTGLATGLAAGPTEFHIGQRVRVKDQWPEHEGPCHLRTPHYLRGRDGVVEKLLGRFPNPEDLAFARPAPARALYHVAFPLNGLWEAPTGAPVGGPAGATTPGHGSADDTLLVEIYEHWLEAA